MLFGPKKITEKTKHQKISYAQSGEDIIIDFIFSLLRIEKPTYLDIGAHHPYYLSNTAYFYDKGCRGVSVEPDPDLFKVIKAARPLETCLNIGVSETGKGESDFYIMNVPTLNTFSEKEAKRYAGYPDKSIKQVIKLQLMGINEIISKYFDGKSPDFISIDVEGMDLEIVRSLDFKLYRPSVICVETLSYTENNTEEKQHNIIKAIESAGYMLYADTYINSIFVEKEKWKNR